MVWMREHAGQIVRLCHEFVESLDRNVARVLHTAARVLSGLHFKKELCRASTAEGLGIGMDSVFLLSELWPVVWRAVKQDVFCRNHLGDDISEDSFLSLFGMRLVRDLARWRKQYHYLLHGGVTSFSDHTILASSLSSAGACPQTYQFFRTLTGLVHLKELLLGGASGLPESRTSQSGSVDHSSRRRNIFPLPLLAAGYDGRGDLLGTVAVDVTNFGIVALNSLYGCAVGTAPPIQAQISVQCGLFQRCLKFMHHVGSGNCDFTPGRCFDDLVKTGAEHTQSGGTAIRANDFDLLEVSGKVDPLPVLDADMRIMLSSPRTLFEKWNPSLRRFPNIPMSDMCEYSRLVALQLASRKVELRRSILAGGSVFGVGKKGSCKLREVWNGSRLSNCSTRPPPPPHLLSLSSLLSLEATPQARLTLSKRDGDAFSIS